MEIVRIFAIVEESLYTVQYEHEEAHEFSRLFDLWNDATYLESFFEMHKTDLQSGFWGDISVEQAVLQTRKEAKALERKLIQIAEYGKTDRYETLSTLFQPLYDNPTKIEALEKNKVKGLRKPGWLRMYAIRIEANLFVVSGGAIKLTKTMNDRTHLLLELEKLELTRQYLQDEENEELEIFELF